MMVRGGAKAREQWDETVRRGERRERNPYKTASLPGEWNGVMKRKGGGGGGAQGRALGPVIKLSEQGAREERRRKRRNGREEVKDRELRRN